MGDAFKELWKNPYVRVLLLLLVLYALYSLLARTRIAWQSFFIAWTLAYLVDPAVTWLERHRIARWLGVLLSFLAAFVLLGVASLLISQVVAQLASFVQNVPDMIQAVQAWLTHLNRILPPSLHAEAIFGQSLNNLQDLVQSSAKQLVNLVGANKGSIIKILAGVVGGVVQLVAIVVLTAYLLYGFPRFKTSFLEIVPGRHRVFAKEMSHDLDIAVGGYIRGQLLVAAIVGLLAGLGMTVLGVPLSVALGFFTGLGNLIPFFGPLLAAVPAILLGLTKSLGHAIGAVAVLIVVNQIDGHLITPWVYSRTTKLHPVTVIIAILIGTSLLGLWGAILAVPAAALLKLLYTNYYLTSNWYRKPK